MAIETHSTLVTATNPTVVESYNLTMNPAINENSVVFNDNSQTCYQAICNNYKKINDLFKNLADQFNQVKPFVTGTNLKSNLQKVSNQCAEQGSACLKRKEKLQELYQYSEGQAHFAKLEENFDSLLKAYQKLQGSYDSLLHQVNNLSDSNNNA